MTTRPPHSRITSTLVHKLFSTADLLILKIVVVVVAELVQQSVTTPKDLRSSQNSGILRALIYCKLDRKDKEAVKAAYLFQTHIVGVGGARTDHWTTNEPGIACVIR